MADLFTGVLARVMLTDNDAMCVETTQVAPVPAFASFLDIIKRHGGGNPNHSKQTGEFTSAAGGIAVALKGGVWHANGKPLPASAQAHLKEIAGKGFAAPNYGNRLYFPPSKDRAASYVGQVTDKKGRTKRFYLNEAEQQAAAVKTARVRELLKRWPAYTAKLDKATAGKNPDHAAMAVRLVTLTGMRPGSDRDTGADKKAYGASNMPMAAVSVQGTTVHFAFPAKNNHHYVTSVSDATLSSFVKARQKAGAAELFDTDETKMRDAFKAIVGDPHLKVKDLRTAHGTAAAMAALTSEPVATTEKEFKALQKRVATHVSSVLQNTPKVALDKYILDFVWAKHRATGGR